MDLTLKPEEADSLKRILANYLSDLRMEIVDTEDEGLREQLKQDEVLLKSLIARLGPASMAAS